MFIGLKSNPVSVELGIAAGLEITFDKELACAIGVYHASWQGHDGGACIVDGQPTTEAPYNRKLFFEGEILVRATAIPTLRGRLQMFGTWNKVLGISFLHASDLTLGFATPLAYPPILTAFEIGGEFCVGSQVTCFGGAATVSSETNALITADESTTSGSFFKMFGFIRYDSADPLNNFAMGFISEMTLSKMYDVITELLHFNNRADVKQKINTAIPGLLASGLKPRLHQCAAGISSTVDIRHRNCCTVEESKNNVKFPECFASFSINPGMIPQTVQRTVDGSVVGLTVRGGYTFSGRFNILGWEIAAELIFSSTQFKIDAEMDKIDLFNNALVLARCDPTVSTCDAALGPKLFIDAQVGQIPEMKIQAFLAIKHLMLTASCDIDVGEDKLYVELNANLFSLFCANVIVNGSGASRESKQNSGWPQRCVLYLAIPCISIDFFFFLLFFSQQCSH